MATAQGSGASNPRRLEPELYIYIYIYTNFKNEAAKYAQDYPYFLQIIPSKDVRKAREKEEQWEEMNKSKGKGKGKGKASTSVGSGKGAMPVV